ncbi:unnamed protein product [Meganyctiphanes norvegica]|uniref:Sphingomyelin phosphodiesterase n=1 Tax=Meganyctiphanes norvegica TaxID=48144 RepID=A0AAV2PHX2_MEGNR
MKMANHSSFWFLIYFGCLASFSPSYSYHQTDLANSYFSSGQFTRLSPEIRDLTCLGCRTLVSGVADRINDGATVEEIEEAFILECVVLDLFPGDVCEGMVRLLGEQVVYVVNHTSFEPSDICGFVLGFDHCSGYTGLTNWTVDLPPGKPEPDHPEPQEPESPFRILHLSDLHVDLDYAEGAAVNCDYPLCCREAYGMAQPGEEAAGPWGGRGHCDIPAHTLDHLLGQAKEIVQPHMVYVTGDLPPHDVWDQTRDSNMAALNLTTSLLYKHFPDIPVLAALGNHEAVPVNSYPVPSVYEDGWDITWLYENLAEKWSYWLPDEVLPDVLQGGFYVVSPYPGLRVISVNMNYCGTGNFFLLMDNVDPVDEMKWLVYQLTEAENMGDKVHILGHIPSGDTCDKTWSHVFNSVVTRFESTIRGLFFGHTHHDEWEVMYDVDDATRPVGIQFITPSATTYSYAHYKSPSFRVYTTDGGYDQATWAVIDHTTYSMNLTEANANGLEPIYQERYSAVEAYGVTGLSPASIDNLVTNMATDDALFQTYLRHRFTYAEEPSEVSECDTDCRKSTLCTLVTADSSDDRPCQRIKDIINGNE